VGVFVLIPNSWQMPNLWPRQLMLGKASQQPTTYNQQPTEAAILANCRLSVTFKFVSVDSWQIIELAAAPVKKGFMDLL